MYRFLIFICLFKIFQQVQTTKNEQSFHCDTQDKIDELKNFDENFIRVVHKSDFIYFVFKKRVIYTRHFSHYPIEQLPALKAINLIHFNFNEKETTDEDKLNQKPGNYEVIGNFYDINGNVYEFYSNLTEHSKINGMAYEIDGENSFATRKASYSIDDIPTDINLGSERNGFKGVEKYLKRPSLKYFNVAQYRGLHGTKEDILVLVYKDQKTVKFEISFYMNKVEKKNYKSSLSTDLKAFTLYRAPKQDESHFFYWLVSIDENFEINLDAFLIEHRLNGYYDIANKANIKIRFSELLNCHTKVQKERELKGIYQNSKSQYFYIFINRFYLKIQKDLVASQFYLTESDYLIYGRDLKYGSEVSENAIEFGHFNNKWIFALNDKVYLKPLQFIFELSFDKLQNVALKKVDTNELGDCRSQTLVIEKQIYCFDRQDYYLIDQSKKPAQYLLNTIFNDKLIDFKEGSELVLIFKYKEDQIVFMSSKSLFVFKYKYFTVNSTNNKINYQKKVKDSTTYYILKNCLLDSNLCESKTEVTEVAKRSTKLNYLDLVIYIVPIVSILIIILIITCKLRSKSKKRPKLSDNAIDKNRLQGLMMKKLPSEQIKSSTLAAVKTASFKTNSSKAKMEKLAQIKKQKLSAKTSDKGSNRQIDSRTSNASIGSVAANKNLTHSEKSIQSTTSIALKSNLSNLTNRSNLSNLSNASNLLTDSNVSNVDQSVHSRTSNVGQSVIEDKSIPSTKKSDKTKSSKIRSKQLNKPDLEKMKGKKRKIKK